MVVILALMATVSYGQQLDIVWEVTTLEAPESVIYDKKGDRYIVSNVAGQHAEKNGKGYLSLISKNGQVIEQKWVTGLHAPKGLGIFNERLFIADIDYVVVVDLKTGLVGKRIKAEGATFLNDIAVDDDGTVYVTDTFGGNAIYKIDGSGISQWLKDDRLNYPNGLEIVGKEIYVSTWGVVTNGETFETEVPGILLAVDLRSQEIRTITKPSGNFDGLQKIGKEFLVSDWISGALQLIDAKGTVKLVKQLNPGSADILYMKNENKLIVPQMLDGKLVAYTIK